MIESLNNEKIKTYAKLNDKKWRKEYNLFIAPGKHLVEEALKKGIVKDILLLKDEINPFNHEVTYVTEDILKKVSGLTNSPKTLAICQIEDNSKVEGNIIILDDIKDPGNLGTIIRSAVAFNYQTIILSQNCVDIYNPKVVRATEGMLFHTNIVIADIKEIIPKLKLEGYKIYGTDVIDGSPVKKETNPHALIIGSEAAGISKEIKELCDENLYIEMNSECESLNAGVSASILMYILNGR